MERTGKPSRMVTASALLLLLTIVGGQLACGSVVLTQERKSSVRQFPRPTGHINDFGELLATDQREALTKIASDFERRTTAELVVVIVDTISPFESIEPYATKLFNEWGIGKKGKNNGVLLLVAVKERMVRIEVGLGLEQILSDEKCKEILQTEVTPRLKNRDFYEALKRGMESIIKEIEK